MAATGSDPTHERAGLRGVPIAWAQIGVLAAILLVLPFGRRVDPDFWWHLRAGRQIIHSGIPRHDVYSFTVSGHSWVAHEWLSEAIIYVVESILGYAGNVLLFGVGTLASLALMLRLARRKSAGTRFLVLLLVITTVLFAFFVTVRPQEFTWLLFAVFIYVLERHEDGDRVQLWALPFLMALWVNLHLGFVYGLLVVAVWLAAKVWQRLRGLEVRLLGPVAISVACLAATMLNPHGPAILGYVVHYFFAGKTERSLIQEWRRPYFGLVIAWPLLLASILIVFSVLSRSRPSLFLCAVSLIAIGLSAQAARNIPFVALLLLPVAGGAAAGRWRFARSEADSRLRVPALFVASLMGVTGACVLVAWSYAFGGVSGWQPSSSGYPAQSVAYLRENEPGARIFNAYEWGGYLIDNLYPNGRVFIDGRADVYGAGLVRDYVTIAAARPGWQALLERYQVDAVLISPQTQLSISLRQETGWQEVYKDRDEDLFVRRST